MSDQLDEVDKMLLGEHQDEEKVNVDTKHESANDSTESDQEVNGDTQQEYVNESTEVDFPNPLIAMAGALVKVDRSRYLIKEKEDTVEASESGTKERDIIPASKKRGAAPITDGSDNDTPTAKKRAATKKARAATSVKSNAKDDKTTSSMLPPRKRTSSNKKANGAVIKTELQNEADDGGSNPDTAPKTPSPKKQRTRTKKGRSESDGSVSPSKVGDITVRNTPRKRNAPKTALAPGRGIPQSWDTADAADRMLVTMKEQGKDWPTIREAWKIMTGSEVADSTLPNRYNRIKINMMRLKEGDGIHLIAAKKDVENELWSHVATKMEKRGADNYPPTFLQKKFKEIEEIATTMGMTVEVYVERLNAVPRATISNELSDEDIANGKAIDAYVEPQTNVGGSQ